MPRLFSETFSDSRLVIYTDFHRALASKRKPTAGSGRGQNARAMVDCLCESSQDQSVQYRLTALHIGLQLARSRREIRFITNARTLPAVTRTTLNHALRSNMLTLRRTVAGLLNAQLPVVHRVTSTHQETRYTKTGIVAVGSVIDFVARLDIGHSVPPTLCLRKHIVSMVIRFPATTSTSTRQRQELAVAAKFVGEALSTSINPRTAKRILLDAVNAAA